ncbi:hypothetical protein [Leifsonia sp. Leaf264]|uniref:hypothetical protein n=1 Tax=Leifsonia sp. Leaf264 TaxID=1736314 RepID=UPI000701558B|nr:hypothetical protein [Leifsonia sp. Leaf264]KQO98368.1 hypothetical protein ASF30_09925 [Leifsonia sp. Leaf264]
MTASTGALAAPTQQITLESSDGLYELDLGSAGDPNYLMVTIRIKGRPDTDPRATIVLLSDILHVITQELEVKFTDVRLAERRSARPDRNHWRIIGLLGPDLAFDTRIQGPGTFFSDRGNPVVIPSNHAATVSFGIYDSEPDGYMRHTVMAVRAIDFLNAINTLSGLDWVDAGGYVTRHLSDPLPPFEVFPNRTTADWVDPAGREINR